MLSCVVLPPILPLLLQLLAISWFLLFLPVSIEKALQRYREMRLVEAEQIAFQSLFGRHSLQEASRLKLDQFSFANGAFADIRRGIIGDKMVAVKVWRGVSLSRSVRRELEMASKRFLRQLDHWAKTRHPNIVPLRGVVLRIGNIPSLVIPYYKNGNVMNYLLRNPAADKLRLIEGLATAIGYLHGSALAHGDIKGSNVLVNDAGEACLCDIGVSNISFPQEWNQAHGTGSARWTAPELMNPKEDDDATCPATTQSDVYSLGMTILEIMTGSRPFSHRRHDSNVVCDVYHGRRPPRPFTPDVDPIWEIIECCWHQDPARRPTMNAVCSWISMLMLTREVETTID